MFSQVNVITKISNLMIFKFLELMENFDNDFQSMLLQDLVSKCRDWLVQSASCYFKGPERSIKSASGYFKRLDSKSVVQKALLMKVLPRGVCRRLSIIFDYDRTPDF